MKEKIKKRLLAKRIIQDMGYITPCWLWTGHLNNWGYGIIHLQSGCQKVHRVAAWIFLDLNILGSKMQICHRCDIPKCFNPDHLFKCTQRMNMQDCVDKHRLNTQNGTGWF